MVSTKRYAIAGASLSIVSVLAGALIAGNMLAGTVNQSEAITQPSNANISLTATDEAVIELLNNATTAVNNGNNTQAILDVIEAIRLENTLRTTTADVPTNNQTAQSGIDLPNPLQ